VLVNKILKEKIMEAFSSVLPITVIVLVVTVVLTPMTSGTILMFLTGAALLIVGMGFFTLGVDMAMMPMGESVGIQLTKSSKIVLVIITSFVIGALITYRRAGFAGSGAAISVNSGYIPDPDRRGGRRNFFGSCHIAAVVENSPFSAAGCLLYSNFCGRSICPRQFYSGRF